MVQSLTPPPEMPKTVMPIPPINGTEIAGTMATEETTTVNTTGAMPTEPMNLSYFIIGPPVPPVQEVINTNTPHPPTTPTTETTPTTPTAEITPTTPTTPTTETTTNTPTKETTPTTATLPTPSPAPQPPIIGGASTATFTWTVMVISLTMVLSAFCF
uniref:Uncharacterized protein n=1 Tax=Meloidogyne hapla TaxID=6305 RepID=A0A1I8C1I5_MELHA